MIYFHSNFPTSRDSGLRAKRDTTTNYCSTTIDCNAIQNRDKYRTIDGTCNNLVNTTWGAAYTIQSRLIDEVYSDGGKSNISLNVYAED